MSFGARLRHFREAKGLTQEELEQRAHLPNTAISKIENGSRQVLIEEGVALAQVLHVDISVLVGLDENPTTQEPGLRHLQELFESLDPSTRRGMVLVLRSLGHLHELIESLDPSARRAMPLLFRTLMKEIESAENCKSPSRSPGILAQAY